VQSDGENREPGVRVPLWDVHTILIFACNLLGDSICRLPAMGAAKEMYPDSRVLVVADPRYGDVFEGQPFIDEVWPLSRRGQMLAQAREWLGVIARARRARPDLVLDLYGSKRTALVSRLTGARFRAGLHRDGLSRWYTLGDLVDAPALQRGHIIERMNEAVAPAGVAARFAYRPLAVSEGDREAARAALHGIGIEEGADLVVLNPAARVEAKRWAAERFGQLARAISGSGGPRCAVITAPDQETHTEEVVNASGGAAVALPMLELKPLAALLENAAVLVTGDTGILHLGTAMGAASLVLAGPTDPQLFAYPSGRQAVLFNREACPEWGEAEQCPRYNTCQDRRCIDAITVEEAVEAARELLSER
jgi:heptosyltransferase-2